MHIVDNWRGGSYNSQKVLKKGTFCNTSVLLLAVVCSILNLYKSSDFRHSIALFYYELEILIPYITKSFQKT